MTTWTAQIAVKWNKSAPHKKTWDWLKEWKEVKMAWSTMGEWDIILWVDVKTPDEAEAFVWNKLRSQDWVEDTWTTWTHQVWNRSA